ncbi:MAG: GTPase ObgE, partial [Oscillospiraceae bacterium]|nr:GTPase ObgE [Oscillospiraceae bacterium]
GGPDGGDGGKGGDIIFVADDNLSTLVDFRYKRKYVAPCGENGRGNNCFGKKGDDLIIKVPRGTIIKDAATGAIMADISTDKPVLIAKGGKGGWGNSHFATPTRQIPRFAKPGFLGEEFELILELKLLADVGLVGFPNVGKSTLISVISSAKPKIANYHFTTLVPVLGVVRVEDSKSFVVADIPGLIEGANKGVGLGHAFLRHVERCRLIVHVVDVSGSEGRDPKEDFELINKELKSFSEDLCDRKQIVVANKCDIATKEQIDSFRSFAKDKGLELYEISAATTQGTENLVKAIAKTLDDLPPIVEYIPNYMPPLVDDCKKFDIEVKDGVYFVDAPWLDQILCKVNMDDYESLQYLQRVLRDADIIEKLENMGISEGDTVNLQGFEFDFVY